MVSSTGSAPAWLFAFVDLAFLLLLALTQLGDGQSFSELELAGLELPRIDQAAATLVTPGVVAWQLRVHPEDGRARPFELKGPESDASSRIDARALASALAMLRTDGAREPFLAPHADSRSEDLLQAVAAIDSTWGERRRALVLPRSAR